MTPFNILHVRKKSPNHICIFYLLRQQAIFTFLTSQPWLLTFDLNTRTSKASFYVGPNILWVCYQAPMEHPLNNVIDGWIDRQTNIFLLFSKTFCFFKCGKQILFRNCRTWLLEDERNFSCSLKQCYFRGRNPKLCPICLFNNHL